MESGNHGQHHEHHHHDFSETETLGGVFFLNLTFTLIEIAGGLWTNQRSDYSGGTARCW